MFSQQSAFGQPRCDIRYADVLIAAGLYKNPRLSG